MDRETRAHLEGSRDQIARILDPKFSQGNSGVLNELRIFADNLTGQPAEKSEDCWPDYEVRP
jgi:hypothetical protein